MGARKALALAAFMALEIVFLPFTVICALLGVTYQVYQSRQLGVSWTALLVLNDRWLLHIFDLRRDDATAALSNSLRTNTPNIVRVLAFPYYLYYKMSGGHRLRPSVAPLGQEGFLNLVPNRTMYIDAYLRDVTSHVSQFVILGAGFDTRSYRFDVRSLSKYELDRVETQRVKREAMSSAGVDTSDVKFVSVDFASQNWTNSLLNAGFNASQPAVFLWEGVTLYLSEKDVRATLSTLRQFAAPGSRVIADFYSNKFVTGGSSPMLGKLYKMLRTTNEEFRFALDFKHNACTVIEEFVRSEGLSLGRVSEMGLKTRLGTWMVVAELLV